MTFLSFVYLRKVNYWGGLNYYKSNQQYVCRFQDWGKSCTMENLKLKWHIPSAEEKTFAVDLLEKFLLPELEALKQHIADTESLER